MIVSNDDSKGVNVDIDFICDYIVSAQILLDDNQRKLAGEFLSMAVSHMSPAFSFSSLFRPGLIKDFIAAYKITGRSADFIIADDIILPKKKPKKKR